MCNICRTTLFGNESRGHIARCVEARYDIRGIRASLKGRSRTVHISVGSPERPHWMELGVRADTTLHELDRFLRSVWLECCGHLSHFDIAGVVYSVMVPRPGDDFAFLPMDEREEQWRHMGRTVGTAIRPATWFEHQYDYGTTTGLDLRHAGEFEGLVQALGPSQPWHGGKIVVLARNHPLQSCSLCGRPAQWRLVPADDDFVGPGGRFRRRHFRLGRRRVSLLGLGRCRGHEHVLRRVRARGRRLQRPAELAPRQWRHMGRTVGTAIRPAIWPAIWFEHQYDYGTTTDLDLRHAGEFEGLVQALGPSQPWHGGKIVVLVRNHPLRQSLQ